VGLNTIVGAKQKNHCSTVETMGGALGKTVAVTKDKKHLQQLISKKLQPRPNVLQLLG
jgi:hypothetical protein